MIITRAQSASNNQANKTKTNNYSDNESDISLPGFESQNVIVRTDNGRMAECGRDHERVRIEQRFNDMNRLIGELTTLVLNLTEKLSSGIREREWLKCSTFKNPKNF